jgi:vacuolar-type H+-ATPase subunit I/STV1
MFQSSAFEKLYPFLLCVVGAVAMVAGFNCKHIPSANELSELFSAAINVAGITIGFLATMYAILLGIKQTRTVRELRKLNRWKGVLSKIRAALLWSFLVAMTSSIILVVDSDTFNTPVCNYVALGVWGLLVGGAIGSAHLVVNILFAIVEQDDAAADATT